MINGPTWSTKLRAEIGKAVIGQDAVVERMLVALLANGHVLLEGMPGLAKTLLIKSLGTALGVFTFLVLLRDSVKAAYDAGSSAAPMQ